jgi:hypothetical protein
MTDTMKTAILTAFATADTHLIAAAFGLERAEVERVLWEDAKNNRPIRWTKKEIAAWNA